MRQAEKLALQRCVQVGHGRHVYSQSLQSRSRKITCLRAAWDFQCFLKNIAQTACCAGLMTQFYLEHMEVRREAQNYPPPSHVCHGTHEPALTHTGHAYIHVTINK